jgi:N-acyl-D-amino-acid deacylase
MRTYVLLSVLLAHVLFARATSGQQPLDAIPISGESIDAFAGLDKAIVGLIAKHDLPGVSIAISDNGRLIHSCGYGYADREAGEPVSPTSRFRIASISKPITAVAILRLVDKEKLRLEDRVFEILDAPEPIDGAAEPDQRLKDVTIKHLLQHRGGWDRDKSFDPMFRSVQWAEKCRCLPPAMPNDVIRAMHSQPLDFDPGQRYAYSNYGYCLLGRVIEKLSGQSYEDFVCTEIFQPLDINSIRLGKTRVDERQTDEAKYYHPDNGKSVFANDLGKQVPSPYGTWCLEAMDSHGGWIATASDLVRFMDAIPLVSNIDTLPSIPLLSRDSIRSILTAPDSGSAGKDSYYGLGWTIRPGQNGSHTIWHTGSLPGTATELTRRSDGRCFAVLINSRSGAGGKNPLNDVTGAIHRALVDLNHNSTDGNP